MLQSTRYRISHPVSVALGAAVSASTSTPALVPAVTLVAVAALVAPALVPVALVAVTLVHVSLVSVALVAVALREKHCSGGFPLKKLNVAHT